MHHFCGAYFYVIGKIVQATPKGAFDGYTSLTSITISDSVTSIGYDAFSNCTALTTAKFDNPNAWFIASSASATTGTDVTTLTADFSEANATVLKNIEYGKYLKRKTA